MYHWVELKDKHFKKEDLIMKRIRGIKLLAILLIIVMGVTSFSGCGNSGSNGKEDYGSKKVIRIKYWLAGFGNKWLEPVIEGFEKKYPDYKVVVDATSSQSAITSAWGNPEIDDTDLYLCIKKESSGGLLEPLDDVLDSKADGESKTIREKFSEGYLRLEEAPDGHYYNLTFGGSLVGIYYNKEIFNDVGLSEPRTTNELVVACDTLYADGKKAFCHFKPVGYWEDYMADVFFTQYNGLDYVLNNFYGCTDEEGNSPSLNVFTKEDGRYEALKVFAQVVTPEYTMVGSNTYDHTTVQTMWLQGESTMMICGSWIASEMASVEGGENMTLMKTPVLSSIVNNLTTVKSEKQLKKVISAIDNVTDGVEEESVYKKDNIYVVDSLEVSQEDWETLRLARNTMATNASGNSAYIPTYADQKEGAKEFLRYLYSDEGYKIYANTLQQTLPITLDSGELDTSNWTDAAQKQAAILDTTEQLVSSYYASKHPIFNIGGARWKAYDITYCDKFCSNNKTDRMTAEEAWKDSLEYAKDNYETNWLAELK